MKFFATIAVLLQAVDSCHGGDSLRSSHRRLSYELIWTYEPRSLVTDQAAIDLDLHVIKQELAVGTSSSYITAESVYREGAHSKSTAKLLLDDPLDRDLPMGAAALGLTQNDGKQVKGQLAEDAQKGDTTILVQYATNQIQENYVGCQVGASPSPNVRGCFTQSGDISFVDEKVDYGYVYNVTTQNLNYRTIQGFSTEAKAKMAECANCPYPDYKKFTDYYGKNDYGDHIITSAFNGLPTRMANGNMQFELYKEEARTEVIQKAMAYMNVWMQVIREMEVAIDECHEECAADSCDYDPGVHSWDQAVAFYTGSRNALPDNSGDLMFKLADERCTEFRTCGEKGKDVSGTSHVNNEIFRYFKDGQRRISLKDCEGAREVKAKIVSLMTIPLIQGTIRYAHMIAGEEEAYNEKHGSEGAIFAMTVLPIIADSNEFDAQIIYANMKVKTNPEVDFKTVKSAFERNYAKLGIKCNEVGGIYDDILGQYKPDASPCVASAGGMDDEQRQLAMALGFALGGIFVVAIVVCIVGRLSESKVDKAMSHQPTAEEVPEAITDHEIS